MVAAAQGLDAFGHELNPRIVAAIRSWSDDPDLRNLHQVLQSRATRRGFLDTYAEAIVAAHVRGAGCSVQIEQPTPSGRTCDLVVARDGAELHIHVKRIAGRRAAGKRLRISSRLRILERIARPWTVKIRWHEGAGDEQMQQLVMEAASFIETAQLGDELVVHDERGGEIGGVRIIGPSEGPCVSLAIGLPEGFIDDTPRIRRLVHRAHKQFMPRAVNLVLICTEDRDGAAEVESAFLGAHQERWDAHPPRGARVAVGRGDDGFWQGRQFLDSQLGGWFRLAPQREDFEGSLFVREGCSVDDEAVALARSLFEPS